MVITIFDALGIQGYLFGSNKLTDNIGASYLVNQALEIWLVEAAKEEGLDGYRLYPTAGGNAVYRFNNLNQAKTLSKVFSKKILQRAPGLKIACHHHEYNDGQALGKALKDAFKGLMATKAKRVGNQPLFGLGVTQECQSGTREPAIESHKGAGNERRFLGPTALAKVKCQDQTRRHLEHFFENQMRNDFSIPFELDHLGRSHGEKSYIGVVHLDGNGIGSKVNEIYSKNYSSDDEMLESLKAFSLKIKEAGTKALQEAMDLLVLEKNLDLQSGTCADCAFSLVKVKGKSKYYLPFRPLVYGGDDITFVCDGRIALDLAAKCLKTFHRESQYHACAGVAIVKSHYPFSRAYNLAEDLCGQAKVKAKNNGQDGSFIDWHIMSGGPLEDISSIREREYKITSNHYLTCRPYQVAPLNSGKIEDWNVFRDEFLLRLKTEKKWVEAHSRLKSLTEYLRQGPDVVGPLLQEWETKGYPLPFYGNFTMHNGFYAQRTPYLDALELLDLMVMLEE